jgi:hypothetical protein
MSTRALSDLRPVPRRGLSREESAMYIGISPDKFDELVRRAYACTREDDDAKYGISDILI